MTAGDGFHHLWPTIVLERVVPGHEPANRELLQLIRELERDNPDLTTDYAAGNFLTLDHPAVGWLRDCVNVTVRDYLRHAHMDYDIAWTLHGWANVNRFGDYHDCHNHPHAYLSGTYYVQIPTAMERLRVRRDARPGRLSLYDPRSSANMTAIRGDPNIEAEHTVDPAPGLIALWPAFVHHFVHPNLSRQERVSVSFNVMLEWRDAYLPAQT